MKNTLALTLSGICCLLLWQCTKEEVENPDITLADGFNVELIYSPSEYEQGSWVCMTTDDQGRLLTSDQYGGLYRVTLGSPGKDLFVEEIPLAIGRAQGLLWAFNSLYVSVNTYPAENGLVSGVYRLTDSNGDDQLDKVDTLALFDGAGEHGPHSLVLGPEGNDIYFIAGNHTDIPRNFHAKTSVAWKEDRLTPAVKDPRGHANDRGAPGGWIARTDPEGNSWEVVANGFRNAYDIAFNENGELFTYDSDMEWDLGTPWYRPTRICHVIPGAEFGWRTGSAKWPEYYPDNLPGTLPMGQGSPTGITFGKGTHFPEKYQRGLFVSDWSFGTMYFVSLTAEGASYLGTSEEFLSGVPLPITDVVVGGDGSLYFTTGGRRSASALYKVSYSNPQEPVEVAENIPPAATFRKKLEALDSHNSGNLDTLWPYLGHEDRYLRYAARIALENQPIILWEQKPIEPDQVDITLQHALALIRKGDGSQKQLLLTRLAALDLSNLDDRQKLDLTRIYGLLFSRWGAPDTNAQINIPSFPSGAPALDRELCALLVYLKDDNIVAAAIPLMEQNEATLESELITKETLTRSDQYGPVIDAMRNNRPFEQSMALALSLSHATEGWTPKLRVRYFKWFYQSLSKSGGDSYKGFLEKIRQAALAQMPVEEKATLAALSGESLLHQTSVLSETVPPPEGPGRVWEVGAANGLIGEDTGKRSFEHGLQMYQALRCGGCHIMQDEGGNIGPNLTQLSTRFSSWDVLQSLQTPSLAISDQYAATLFTLADQSTLIGRTISSDDDSLYVNINPYQPHSVVGLSKENIIKEELSPVSLMPGGLINQLNEEELLDLMAYLQSGGDPDHEVFEKNN